MSIINNELSSFIDCCFKEASNSVKERSSLAGEPVKAIFKNIQIKNQQISLHYQIKGYTGNVYEEDFLSFDSVVFPYYYIEVLRLSMISYWSGNLITKKDKKRFLFILEYGETNRHYLNRSLKYLFHFKRILGLNKK
ncbi:hypothetical protein AAGG74_14530 [Bacillus mexicanus]|uniref:hypothetical protein n=1 Tax=Bacillus mexicanus TaxID=2834415 RepID=UPI003D19F029